MQNMTLANNNVHKLQIIEKNYLALIRLYLYIELFHAKSK